MNVQTISIVVPSKGCINNCPFCVSKMHKSPYENNWNENGMIKRIKYAILNNVNTCIITGTGEPLQNESFLKKLRNLFNRLDNPFPNVEFQTTGILLLKRNVEECYENIELLKELGVNTISLSISDIFSSENNSEIIGIHKKHRFFLTELIPFLKKEGFNVRLSLNMLKSYDKYTPEDIIQRCSQDLKADQITFRKMYYSDENNEQSKWVKENNCSDETLKKIKRYITGGKISIPETDENFEYTEHIRGNGIFLYKLPFGAKVYSINGMSVVIDDDCMSKENNESLKYIILRENGKLYCRWDDEGSLIF